MTRSFADKAVIVTGAASGIGRTTALRFAAEGARVCVADLDADGAAATVATIAAEGGTAFACRVDIAQEADNERMVQETMERFGGLDIAFLNAGYLGATGNFFELDTAHFDRVIAVNLRGVFLGLQSVGRHIRAGGAVVVTSSAAGLQGWTQNAAYSASKHGVIGLVRSAAEAFAARGVRINAICPGGVTTGLLPSALRANEPDNIVPPDELPMPAYRGGGRTQHIAEFVLYLSSGRAAFLNGAAYPVDAGLLSAFG